MNSDELIEELEVLMSERDMNWRKLEIEFEGKVTRSLKRKVKFNIEKLNGILKGLGVELSVKKMKKNEGEEFV